MVYVLKENWDVRICIDMKRANTAIFRDSLLPHFRKAEYFLYYFKVKFIDDILILGETEDHHNKKFSIH